MVETKRIELSTLRMRTVRSPEWSAKRALPFILEIAAFRAGMRTTQRTNRARFAMFISPQNHMIKLFVFQRFNIFNWSNRAFADIALIDFVRIGVFKFYQIIIGFISNNLDDLILLDLTYNLGIS